MSDCVCVACVCLFRVCVCGREMSFYPSTMSGCREQSGVCSEMDSIDMDLGWFWASHWILFSTIPVFPPSYGRHGPAKQTAVHPATWLELHLSYEWQLKPYTPRSLTVIYVCSEWEILSVFVWDFSFCSVESLWILCCDLTSIWTPRTDSGWLFAIHYLHLFYLGLYLTCS